MTQSAWSTVATMSNRTQLLIIAMAVLAASLLGCSSKPAAVNPQAGATALCESLDSWKAGKRPTDMRDHSPAVIVGDHQWEAGTKLVSYRVIEPPAEMGSALLYEVELNFQDNQEQEVQEIGRFMVGTDPKITVIRQ